MAFRLGEDLVPKPALVVFGGHEVQKLDRQSKRLREGVRRLVLLVRVTSWPAIARSYRGLLAMQARHPRIFASRTNAAPQAIICGLQIHAATKPRVISDRNA
jgi:hypothetical protein